jgi:phosphatidylglycerophosphatase A
MIKIARLFSTFFGVGFLPLAPGTWGSLLSLPIGYWLVLFGGVELLFITTLGLFIIGVWSSGVTSKEMKVTDPSQIVIDEVVGQWLTLLVLPLNIFWYFIGFMLFRLLDIYKPWPISWVDKKIKGGLGIMLDDIIAGMFAAAVLWTSQSFYQNFTLD